MKWAGSNSLDGSMCIPSATRHDIERNMRPFLEPHLDDRLTTDTLFAAYRETVTKQLAA